MVPRVSEVQAGLSQSGRGGAHSPGPPGCSPVSPVHEFLVCPAQRRQTSSGPPHTGADSVTSQRIDFPDLPFVGRDVELRDFDTIVRHLDDGESDYRLLCGPSGVGKTRLLSELEARAQRGGVSVFRGAAFPVDYGVPFALWAEAFLPHLRMLDEATLATLSRGGGEVLQRMFPGLGAGSAQTDESVPGDFLARTQWVLGDLLRGMANRQPLVVILEDLHWAGDSDLELLHFCLRQVRDVPISWICSYNTEVASTQPDFSSSERWLHDLAGGDENKLGPLPAGSVAELVTRAFGAASDLTADFSAWLHARTGGNPFFVGELLATLVSTGALRKRDGTWVGWEARSSEVPQSISEAIAGRIANVGTGAKEVAGVVAVASPRATFALLSATCALQEDLILEAIDELREYGFLLEDERGGDVVYSFSHPLVREVVYHDLGITRQRVTHRRVAEALRAASGIGEERLEELAYHYSLALGSDVEPEALELLVRAGHLAFQRRAGPEAVRLLAAARERVNRVEVNRRAGWSWARGLDEALGQAYRRVGDFENAGRLLREALETVDSDGDLSRVASVRRQLGQLASWEGDHDRAIGEYQSGETAARAAKDRRAEASLKLLIGVSLQALGDEERARKEMEAARGLAEGAGDPGLLGRVHQGLVVLHTWSGRAEEVRNHAQAAIELAASAGDSHLAFWSHSALAIMEGFLGDIPTMERQLEECRRIAEELRSPVYELSTSEIRIEHAAATGDWDRGIAIGEASVAQARTHKNPVLLARVSVWLGLIYLRRGDIERGEELTSQAWSLAHGGSGGRQDLHMVLPTYIGRVAYHVAAEEYEEAISIGAAGIKIAENSGYLIWAVHRLFPYVMEAHLWLEDIEGARAIADRMRVFTDRLDHRLGKAWLQAFEAIEAWKAGEAEQSVELMGAAADALEAIPMNYDGARIRRLLSGRLAELGRRDEALEQLRRAHDAFSSMGARGEFKKARGMFREIDARPPPLQSEGGAAGLTPRETDIARYASEGKSNKAIAKALSISPRTVSTHLSNIYQKMGLSNRGELSAFVRERWEEFSG